MARVPKESSKLNGYNIKLLFSRAEEREMEELQVFLHPEYCNCVFVPVIERGQELCVGFVLVFSFKLFSYGSNNFLLKNDIK